PHANASGADSFGFRCSDASATGAPGTISIDVVAVNDAPVAGDQTVATDIDTPVAITLTASDVESDPLTYSIASLPTHGSLAGPPPDLTYTPDAAFRGSDQLTFVANDGTVDSAPATVTIVVDTNRPPVADDASVTLDEDVATAITLTGSDPEGVTV